MGRRLPGGRRIGYVPDDFYSPALYAGKPRQTGTVRLQQHESRSHNNGWQDRPEKQFYS
jgi:hypothetical protein